MSSYEVVPSGPVSGQAVAPASKSVTNRALVIAALADGRSVLRDALASDDSAVMLDAVADLGAEVAAQAGHWRITGTGGHPRSPDGDLEAGLSGTTMRFLTAMVVLTPAGATVGGAPQLLRRRIGPLVTALNALGAQVHDHAGYPPVVAEGGGLDGGRVVVDALASSQFASAVLLAAPYARRDVVVDVEGAVATGYIELTAQLMEEWGAEVSREGAARWRVVAGRGYQARDTRVEYDASAAAHLLALAVATGGTVTVTNAALPRRQPDAGIVSVLEAMGARVDESDSAVTVTGPEVLAPVEVDLSPMPDQVTTVAALSALAAGTSRLSGVAVTRGHESDRLAALAGELAKLQVPVEERPDGLVVHGGAPRGPARLATHADHRLAMAFASLAARVPGVTIEDPGCVTKTYPSFWSDARQLGVRWREAP